jgi:hypothetical protein
MQPAERGGHAAPVGLRLGRSALNVRHHYQTVRKQPSVCRRDRHWYGQTFTVKVLEEFRLPREIRITPLAETSDREASPNAHAPYVIGDSASQRFDANYIVTPLPEHLPARWRHCELPLGSLWLAAVPRH